MTKVNIDFNKDFPLNFDKNKKIHFVAVGGIGVSAVAKSLIELGFQVSGSDIRPNKNTKALEDKGARIFIGHDASNIDGAAALVVSSAIKNDNPEIVEAMRQNIPIFHRAQGLKAVLEGLGFDKKPVSIGLTGTHGKTTTTGMTTLIFEMAKKAPTFLIGGFLPQFHTNAQAGSGDFAIAEMDESDGTIVIYNTDILLITNLEVDHVDFYKNGLEQIIDTFEQVVNKTKKIVLNIDDYGCKKLYSKVDKTKILTYSIKGENADFCAKNIHLKESKTVFDVYKKNEKLGQIELQVPGIHNVSNAIGVLMVCLEAGLSFEEVQNGLQEFVGTGRRFEFVGQKDGVKYYDDYAHHPTEIKATISAAKQMNYNKLWLIFQPHTYTRTSTLFNEFSEAFVGVDEVILTDIYAAREIDTGVVSSKMLSESINKISNNCKYIATFDEIETYLKENVKENDLVLTVGAGTITKLGYKLI